MKRTNINTTWVRRSAWGAIILFVGLFLSVCKFAGAGEGGQKEESPNQEETVRSRSHLCTTEDGSMAIEDVVELKAIAENPNCVYFLTKSITLTEPWVPLKTFTGTLDGRGNTIKGLTIVDEDNPNVGFFRELGAGATVKNLIFYAPRVTGNVSTGVVAGTSRATIESIKIDGGTVVSNSGYIGGLVGMKYASGTIMNSYTTSVVSGGDVVGGLVGMNYGAITNSYARGEAMGKNAAGGLVGNHSGAITNSYAAGKVSGRDVVGGLVGVNYVGASITSSYFDTITTAQSKGIGTNNNNQNEDVKGLGSAPAQGAFGNWDFDDVWTFNQGAWPTLK